MTSPLGSQPTIRLLPHERVFGWSGKLDDSGNPLNRNDDPTTVWASEHLFKALLDEYDTDAHCQVPVRAADTRGVPEYPRLTKAAMAATESWDWRMQVAFVDLDRNDHQPWTGRGARLRVQARLVRALREDNPLHVAAVYTTRAGLRLVVVLEPHPVKLWGRYRRWLDSEVAPWVDSVSALDGLEVDNSTIDPTRLMRMPRVVRKGPAGDVLLTPDDIPTPVVLDGVAPLRWEYNESDVYSLTGVRSVRTYEEILDRACRRIRDAPKGKRNPTLAKQTKLVAGFYAARGTLSVEESQARLRAAVDDVYSDPARREEGYNTIAKMWPSGASEPIREDTSWTPEDRPRPYLVMQAGKDGYWVATQDSYAWHTTGQAMTRLQAEWPDLPVWTDTPKGRKPMSLGAAFQVFGGAFCHEVRCNYVDGNGFEDGVLHRRTWYPKQWVPEFDQDVAEWLHLLFDSNGVGLDWLATLGRFERATAIMLLTGPDSVGKGMLAGGISSYLGVEPVFYEVAVGQFNAPLLRSPFVWLNEGVEGGTNTVALRRLVDNKHRIRELYQPPQVLVGHPRVLATGNDNDILGLADMVQAPASARALGRRVLELEVPEKCREWLDRMGGWEFTEGWTETRIPRHLAWLAEERTIAAGRRFLVEGDAQAYMDRLGSRKGIPATLLELLGMLADRWPETLEERLAAQGARPVGTGKRAVWWHYDFPDYVLVSNEGLRQIWQDRLGEKPPPHGKVAEALALLSKTTKPMRPDRGHARVWPIDIERVYRAI